MQDAATIERAVVKDGLVGGGTNDGPSRKTSICFGENVLLDKFEKAVKQLLSFDGTPTAAPCEIWICCVEAMPAAAVLRLTASDEKMLEKLESKSKFEFPNKAFNFFFFDK